MEQLLKEPNVRGEGWSKAAVVSPAPSQNLSTSRVVVKTQHQYFCRPLWNAFRKTPLVRREFRAINALVQKGVAVPLVISYEESDEEACLVTTFVENSQALDAALTAPDAKRGPVVTSVAQAIARLHRAGWTHGALYPDHLLVVNASSEPVTYLIDLEKARKWGSVKRDMKRFSRYRTLFTESEQKLFDTEYAKELAQREQ